MQQTLRPGCEEDSGPHGLAGLCSISDLDYKEPMLVNSTNAVGTKLKVAIVMERFDTIGADLVALCANDIAARGADPLFVMANFSAPKLDARQAYLVNQGLAEACMEAGCTLLGSKTAEMPGIFSASGFDVTGFALGITERSAPLPHQDRMNAGDVILGLPSSGLHSNGFSLLRSLAEAAGIKYRAAAPFDPTRTFGEVLLTPSRVYAKAVVALARTGKLKGATPITSGGFRRGIPRILPQELKAQLNAENWELPPVFRWIAWKFGISCHEMVATFNCGIGMALIVAAEDVTEALETLRKQRLELVKIKMESHPWRPT